MMKGYVSLVALLVVTVVLGSAFAYYFTESSRTISSLNAEVAKDDNRISILDANLSSLQSTVANDKNLISADQSQITSLESKIVADNSTIAALILKNSTNTNLIASLKKNITSEQGLVATLNAQVGNLQGQVSNLTKLVSLSSFQTEFASTSISPQALQLTKLGSIFTVPYSGYVLISVSGSFNVADVAFFVANNYSRSVAGNYGSDVIGFGITRTTDSIAFPVFPGQATAFIYTNQTGVTATVSVTYYS